ncbi:MAG: cache domain-containing protein, partial [Candidatus Mariimomonas ferrooxydans]
MVAIVFINIYGVPFTSYAGRQGQRRIEAFKSLSLIADLKKERLLRWIEERNDDIHVFSSNGLVVANVVWLHDEIEKHKMEGKKDAELWSLMRRRDSYQILIKIMNSTRETYGVYDKIQIADAETGLIYISTNDKDLGTDISQESYFTGALMSHEYYITNIQLAQQSRTPVFYMSHVIKDTDGETIALMVMEVNAEDMLKPMLHTGEGLGARGEALLVNQDARILTSLKHPLPDRTYAKPLEYRIKAKPASLAARGEEGIIESQDYRGEPVLAAYR